MRGNGLRNNVPSVSRIAEPHDWCRASGRALKSSGEAIPRRTAAHRTRHRRTQGCARVIDQAAEAMRYGVAGTAPAAKQITSVGLALSTVAGPTRELDREAMAEHLSSLVTELDLLIAGQQPKDPEAVPAFLTGLMRAADRDTAQSGETLVRRG